MKAQAIATIGPIDTDDTLSRRSESCWMYADTVHNRGQLLWSAIPFGAHLPVALPWRQNHTTPNSLTSVLDMILFTIYSIIWKGNSHHIYHEGHSISMFVCLMECPTDIISEIIRVWISAAARVRPRLSKSPERGCRSGEAVDLKGR